MSHRVVNPTGCLGFNLGNSTNMKWRNSKLCRTHLNCKKIQPSKLSFNIRVHKIQSHKTNGDEYNGINRQRIKNQNKLRQGKWINLCPSLSKNSITMIFNRRWNAFDELDLEEHLKRGSLNGRTIYHEPASNPELQGWICLEKGVFRARSKTKSSENTRSCFGGSLSL